MVKTGPGMEQRIDLHVHTPHSNVFDFPEDAVARIKHTAMRRNVNGIALTEHIHASRFWATHDALLERYAYGDGHYDLGDSFKMFSGAEITTAERVDFIVLGELDEIDNLDAAFTPRLSDWNFVPALDLLHVAAERDLIVIAAHPFRATRETSKLPLDEVLELVDAIEVNGRDQGTEWAIADLSRAYGRAVAGGSDAHRHLEVGLRSTILPYRTLSLDAIRASFVTRQSRVHCKPYPPSMVALESIKRVATSSPAQLLRQTA
jgi:predicted metal-dependent phosphoesterase TrpH